MLAVEGPPTTLDATDLFSGGGGSSEGMAQAGINVLTCANHWDVAIATHEKNHPDTEHRLANLSEVDWRTFPSTAILWASPSCFTAGHLVMTSRGQIPIEDVRIGDLVLTHMGRWRAVNKVMSKTADTVVVKGGGNYAVETTDEHPFYVKNRPRKSCQGRSRRDDTLPPTWKPAGLLGSSDYLATPESVESIPVPEVGGRGIACSEAFWWIVGRWLGDGWTRLEESQGTDVQPRKRTPYQPAGSPCIVCGEPAKVNGNSSRFASPYCSKKCKGKGTASNSAKSRGWLTICCSKEEFEEVRVRLALAPELKWWTKEGRTTWHFTTSHIGLVRWLDRYFGKYAHGKQLPAWAFGMPLEHREALLAGYVSADGCVRRATQIGTASHALAVDIRVLATTLGKIATASKPSTRTRGAIEGRQVNMRPLYTVQWATNPHPEKARTYADGNHRWHAAKSVEPGRNGVSVYNLSVEEDESYVVEGLVVHNCTWHARSGGRKQPPAEVELRRADAGSVDRATAFAVIAAAEVHRYRAIIVENVLEFEGWTLYRWWLDGLRELGYQAQIVHLDAAGLGGAQSRIRYFAVFTHAGDVDLTLPDLEPVPASTILDPNLGKLVAERPRRLYVAPQIEQIAEPDVPHLVTFRRNAKARRADQHPLATITAGGNHHGIATLTDDGPRFRMLTNRECARGQGFPDSYEFVGKADEVKKQIGNAVSVDVARWLSGRVAQAVA